MAYRDTLHGPDGCARRRIGGVPRGEFFSLGALLVPYVKTPTPFAPWTLSAAMLLAVAAWDPFMNGGRFDAILFGLAAYELLIGLTQPPKPRMVSVTARVSGRAARRN
jgi:hypothetical protein